MGLNLQTVETGIEHVGDAFVSFLKGLVHFAVAATPVLAASADAAEIATGNAALVTETDAVAKTVQTVAAIADPAIAVVQSAVAGAISGQQAPAQS